MRNFPKWFPRNEEAPAAALVPQLDGLMALVPLLDGLAPTDAHRSRLQTVVDGCLACSPTDVRVLPRCEQFTPSTKEVIKKLYGGGEYTQSRLVKHTLMHYKSFERLFIARCGVSIASVKVPSSCRTPLPRYKFRPPSRNVSRFSPCEHATPPSHRPGGASSGGRGRCDHRAAGASFDAPHTRGQRHPPPEGATGTFRGARAPPVEVGLGPLPNRAVRAMAHGR